MTTKVQMRAELERCYEFLRGKANTRGLLAVTQAELASELGVGLPKFNRMVHRLERNGLLRIKGGGRRAKEIWLAPVDFDNAFLREEVPKDLPDKRTAAALRLYHLLREAVEMPGR